MDLFGEENRPTMLEFEELVRRQGYRAVAGVDEAGRGALAGPVVAAAVILAPGVLLPGVTDSKKLSPRKRDELYDLIMDKALAVGVGVGDHLLIDRINILQATLVAMENAVQALAVFPDYILIDGIFKTSLAVPQRTIKKGDSASLSIAAASIVAKVTRDRLMVNFEREFPGYGLAEHKGYGCAAHLDAIGRLGPSPIHRRTFRGVKEHVSDANDDAGLVVG
ncbi:MAG TPA: ribonuclease HII [Geobacteraceae bacterium]